MQKIALITGITGQDGAYLAELLLSKGYIVHGLKRRTSLFNTERIDHLYQDPHIDNRNFILHYGDLTDSTNLIRIIQEIQPDEIYNLGAMSHVHVSFEMPEYVADTDGAGTLRILEAVRLLGLVKKTRIYQASTSELYGKVQEIPQSETTPFYPRSPYAVAKLYAFWITKHYREAYGMYAVNGILFNHETVAGNMPLIFKIGERGAVDIKPISQIVKEYTNIGTISIDESEKNYQETIVTSDLYVWDSKGWSKVLYASGYPHLKDSDNKQPRWLVSKNAAYMATGSHVCIMEDGSEKEFQNMEIGDKVNIIDYPNIDTIEVDISEEIAELIGFIVGDGHADTEHRLQLTAANKQDLERYETIWRSMGEQYSVNYWQCASAFSDNMIWQLRLNNARSFIHKYSFYDEYRKKQIPFQILNAPSNLQMAFLKGYNAADGLKSNPCIYEFKNFKTNSTTLAAGLIFILKKVTNQNYNINVEISDKWGKESIYYSINLLSNSEAGQNHNTLLDKKEQVLALETQGVSQRGIARETGISRTFIRKIQNGYEPNLVHHLSKPNNEIKKIIEMQDYEGWFYDLTTETGTFHCGIGQGHVHNSPLRGETFVTRKITRAVAKIALGLQDKLWLGNLNAQRDWGHARDFTEGMWRILQHDTPEDFVLATGKTTEVREFVRMSFAEVGIEIRFEGAEESEIGIVAACNNPEYQVEIGTEVVRVDPRYYRPTEVDLLLGNPAKAERLLGWKATHTVQTLAAEMVAADLRLFKREKYLKDGGFYIKNEFE